MVRIDRLKFFHDSMGGGAWPFLVGGVICLVNSVNERDLGRLVALFYYVVSLRRNSTLAVFLMLRVGAHLTGRSAFSRWRFEAITGL